MDADMASATKKVSTIDEAAAAYGGMPELVKAFGLTIAKGRTNSAERWLQAGVPRYHHLALYLGLQHRGYDATPELFGATSWEKTGISASSRRPP
jgi:hypothetical protein